MRNRLLVLCCCFLTAFAADKPRVLLTNDDGIEAEGIIQLQATLSAVADVTVVAPATNRSATSMSTSMLSGSLRVKSMPTDERGIARYAVDGTPVDAVSFGVLNLGKDNPFDLVISGVNDGTNVGILQYWSGTVGAAKQAGLLGLPAIAISQDNRRRELKTAGELVSALFDKIDYKAMAGKYVLSINIPAGELQGIKVAPSAGMPWTITGFQKASVDGDWTLYNLAGGVAASMPAGSDSEAFTKGWVTITPLLIDPNGKEQLKALKMRLEAIQL